MARFSVYCGKRRGDQSEASTVNQAKSLLTGGLYEMLGLQWKDTGGKREFLILDRVCEYWIFLG